MKATHDLLALLLVAQSRRGLHEIARRHCNGRAFRYSREAAISLSASLGLGREAGPYPAICQRVLVGAPPVSLSYEAPLIRVGERAIKRLSDDTSSQPFCQV